ncbi:DUF1715-domain-containing protein [Hymenopellis radicata]|nr:DUF1715-domain-containing protein [Hymenopellis radicata]
MDFDLESLVHLEQTFFDAGYTDGFDHGRIHGLIEGRALGREKGFEMWEELGYYEGFSRTWRAVLERDQNSRAVTHIRHLLDLIDQFPRVNPDASSTLDISRLQRQIRSRYKALCSTLGVTPSMRAAMTPNEEEKATSHIRKASGP